MSGYDDPYAWERVEAYLAGIRGPLRHGTIPLCPVCRKPKYQKHLETCVGRRKPADA